VAVPVVQVGDLFAPSKMSFSNPVSSPIHDAEIAEALSVLASKPKLSR
jgi:hypothetical protein